MDHVVVGVRHCIWVLGFGCGCRLACTCGFSCVCCSKAKRPLLIVSKKVRADMLSKNMKETAHLIDGDDEMCCHHLHNVARPLTCQVVTSTAIVHPFGCFVVTWHLLLN